MARQDQLYDEPRGHEGEMTLAEQVQADQKTFGEKFQEQLQNSPWWVTSIALHFLAALVMMLVLTGEAKQNQSKIMIVTPVPGDETRNEPQKERPKSESVPKTSSAQVDVGMPSADDTDGPTSENPVDVTVEITVDSSPAPTEDTGLTIFDESASSGPSAKFSGLGTGKSFGGPLGNRRNGRGKKGLLSKHGAPAGTMEAIAAALKWLAYHQNDDGSWDTNPAGGGGAPAARGNDNHVKVAVTGFALLAFLADGHSEKFGKYKKNVEKGIAYLKSVKSPGGQLSSNMYSNGIAIFAIAENVALGASSESRSFLEEVVKKASELQGPGGGYGYSGPGTDTSVTGFSAQAIHSALFDKQFRGDQLTKGMWDKFTTYFKSSRGPDGSTAYRGGAGQGGGSKAMQALGALMAIYMGDDDYAWLEKAVDGLPKTANLDNLYETYYETLVKYQMLGFPNNRDKYKDEWKQWCDVSLTDLISRQVKEGTEKENKGSWQFSSYGKGLWGRTGDTAVSCLCLEVFFRYALSKKGSH